MKPDPSTSAAVYFFASATSFCCPLIVRKPGGIRTRTEATVPCLGSIVCTMCNWTRSPSMPSVHLLATSKTARARGSFTGMSHERSNCPLMPYGLDPRAVRDRQGRENVGAFDRLDLAVLLVARGA